MQLISLGKSHDSETGRDPAFVGTATYRDLYTDEESAQLRPMEVAFQPGGRTKWHHHDTDQLLIIISGRGHVATRELSIDVRVGDLVLIPAGEVHWHGATDDYAMTHLSILTPGELIIDE